MKILSLGFVSYRSYKFKHKLDNISTIVNITSRGKLELLKEPFAELSENEPEI